MATGHPNIVYNSPQDRPVLRQVFAYHADYYDLDAYEKICPGAGQRIWDMIEKERAHQVTMKQLQEELHTVDRFRYLGYRLGKFWN